MGRHDQKVLKFIGQNPGRPPTLVDLMTGLKLNLAEVEESLAALQAQGLIRKSRSANGLEHWYAGGPADTAPVSPAPGNPQVSPRTLSPSTGAWPATPSPYAEAVPQPAAMAPAPSPRPVPPQPPPSPIVLKGGSGIPLVVFCTLLGVAASCGLGYKFGREALAKATKGVVTQKKLDEALAEVADSENKAAARVAALESQLTSLRARLDSLQTSQQAAPKVQPAPPAPPAPPPPPAPARKAAAPSKRRR